MEKGDDKRAGRPVYLVMDHGTKIECYLVGVVVQWRSVEKPQVARFDTVLVRWLGDKGRDIC